MTEYDPKEEKDEVEPGTLRRVPAPMPRPRTRWNVCGFHLIEEEPRPVSFWDMEKAPYPVRRFTDDDLERIRSKLPSIHFSPELNDLIQEILSDMQKRGENGTAGQSEAD